MNVMHELCTHTYRLGTKNYNYDIQHDIDIKIKGNSKETYLRIDACNSRSEGW